MMWLFPGFWRCLRKKCTEPTRRFGTLSLPIMQCMVQPLMVLVRVTVLCSIQRVCTITTEQVRHRNAMGQLVSYCRDECVWTTTHHMTCDIPKLGSRHSAATQCCGPHLLRINDDYKLFSSPLIGIVWIWCTSTLCSEKKHPLTFLSYLHELFVDLNKNCSEHTQGLIDSDNVKIRYSLRSMT